MNASPSPSTKRAWLAHLGDDVPFETLLRALGGGTLHGAAHATATVKPQQPAVTIGDESITHGDLDERARRLAAWLTANGAGSGTRVVLAAANSIEYVVAYLGILHSGAAVALVNPMLTARELALLVEDADPIAAVCDPWRTEQLREIGLRCVLSLGGSSPGSLAGVVEESPILSLRAPEPDATAHLAFTSGTTGRPKAALLTHRNVLASVRSIVLAWRIRAEDVLVHALPLQHAHGLSGLHAVIVTGCRGVFVPSFDPGTLCSQIEACDASVLFAVPAMWERLVSSGELSRERLGRLRLATSGSAPLRPATSEAVLELTGIRPLERYGLTETGFVLSNPYEGERRAGSVGFALPGAEAAVVDSDGREVEDGVVGEVVLRGPSVFAGYAGSGTGEFLEGGWFRTGDLARVEPDDGYFSIVGRSKEMIITGGLNVYPREVELVLETLPGVAAAAVVGLPSARWGEEVTAFLVPASGAAVDIEYVSDAACSSLAAYKRPKRYLVIDELPRNELGKILRSSLVEIALDDGTGAGLRRHSASADT